MRTHTDPITEQLRMLPGLRGRSGRELRRLRGLVDGCELRAGQTLTRQGELAREAFVIIEGRGRVLVDGVQVATFGPGDFVGETAMLDRRPRTATVIADTPVKALVVGPQAFSTFIEAPGVGRTLAVQLAQRLRRANPAA
jgi:CRP-like cAMP-binding protein